MDNFENEKLKEFINLNKDFKNIVDVGMVYKLFQCKTGYLIFYKNTCMVFYGKTKCLKFNYSGLFDVKVNVTESKCGRKLYYLIQIESKIHKIEGKDLKEILFKDGFKVNDSKKIKLIKDYFIKISNEYVPNEDVKTLIKRIERRKKKLENENKRKLEEEERERIRTEEEQKEKLRLEMEDREKQRRQDAEKIRTEFQRKEEIKLMCEIENKKLIEELKNNDNIHNILHGFVVLNLNNVYFNPENISYHELNIRRNQDLIEIIFSYIKRKYAYCDIIHVIAEYTFEIAIKYCSNLFETEYRNMFKKTDMKNFQEVISTYFAISHIVQTDLSNILKLTYFYMNKSVPSNKTQKYFLEVYRNIVNIVYKEDKTRRLNTFEKLLINASKSEKPQKMYCMDDIDMMNGYEFEEFIFNLFKRIGYNSKRTKYSGDQGIDVICEKNGLAIGVQVKNYTTKVSNKAIQEVVGGLKLYKCNKGMVVTNNYFTSSAIELAKVNDVELWDRDILNVKLNELYS